MCKLHRQGRAKGVGGLGVNSARASVDALSILAL